MPLCVWQPSSLSLLEKAPPLSPALPQNLYPFQLPADLAQEGLRKC